MSAMTRFARLFGVAAVVVVCTSGPGRTQAAEPAVKKAGAKIYDPKADADAQVTTAAAEARRDNKRVLLMFGGDWCGWCHKLHALFESDPEIRKVLHDEYVLVPIDLESPNATGWLRECKAGLVARGDTAGVGYPFLAVLDADRKVVTQQRTDPLEEGDHHDPAKVKAFLARWVAEPLDAEKVLADALARAGEQDKRVFLHFGAPWCGWCRKLDEFLARDEVAAILGRDFVEVKVDLDRMAKGKAVAGRYPGAGSGGIPWSAILDAKGEVLITSDGPNGNIGYPAQPAEIDHFLAMLRKTARRIEPAQIDRLGDALRDSAARLGIGRRD